MTTKDPENITIYTAPGCAACGATRDRFNAKGVPFTEEDFLDQTPEKQAQLKATVGQRAPLVVTENHGSWSGLNVTKMKEVVQAHQASGNQSAVTPGNPAVTAGPTPTGPHA